MNKTPKKPKMQLLAKCKCKTHKSIEINRRPNLKDPANRHEKGKHFCNIKTIETRTTYKDNPKFKSKILSGDPERGLLDVLDMTVQNRLPVLSQDGIFDPRFALLGGGMALGQGVDWLWGLVFEPPICRINSDLRDGISLPLWGAHLNRFAILAAGMGRSNPRFAIISYRIGHSGSGGVQPCPVWQFSWLLRWDIRTPVSQF
jgi:hypothetical protein